MLVQDPGAHQVEVAAAAAVQPVVFDAPLPLEPQPLEEVYKEFTQDVLPYPIGNIHPRFWGWVLGSVGMFLSVPLTMVVKFIARQQPGTTWFAILVSNLPKGSDPDNRQDTVPK